jgi:hypothetical protein
MTRKRPNPTFMGWLGRQVGHVRKAIKSKPGSAGATKSRKSAAPRAGSGQQPPVVEDVAPGPAPAAKVIYREDKIEEAELPEQPGVVFRRTVIDEIVVKQEAADRSPEP